MTAHCTGDRCRFSAVTCEDHEQVLYAKKELLDWLEKQRIKNNLFTVSAPASMVTLCTSIRDYKPKTKYFPSEEFGKIIAEHADADISGIETILENDEFKKDEI